MFLRCKTEFAGLRKSLFGVAIRAFLWCGKGFFTVRNVLFRDVRGWSWRADIVKNVRRDGVYGGAEGGEELVKRVRMLVRNGFCFLF
ncbi:MAG: hypothetical protein BHV84_10600 [Prevotella sp. AG:487_50_53]|nr:MAG: hypothetical protein BHV84_10600 [Prevotella sp. AG:487_50_53]